MAKKKPTAFGRKQKEEVNKKALIWVGAILAGVVILMTVLLIVSQ